MSMFELMQIVFLPDNVKQFCVSSQSHKDRKL